jgi:hypothetical protein
MHNLLFEPEGGDDELLLNAGLCLNYGEVNPGMLYSSWSLPCESHMQHDEQLVMTPSYR